jgi:hypothetical protein
MIAIDPDRIKSYIEAKDSGVLQADIVDLIKKDGHSPVESMKILIEIYGMGLRRAKEVVVFHPSWAGVTENNQRLYDDFESVFGRKIRKPKGEVKSILLDEPRSADLTYDELQKLANEIRSVVSGSSLLHEGDLFECADKFPVHKMGIRKSRALINEYKLSSHFTPKFFLKIRDRVKEYHDKGLLEFNESDFTFIERNFNKNNEWMAKNFYADKKDFDQMLKGIRE